MNQPVGCKASTEVGNVEPLGHVCHRKEREEKWAKRGKTCRLQSPGRLRETLGAGTVKQEEKGSSRNGRWAGEPERGQYYGTLRALNRKPMVYNVLPKYRNMQRGTLILYMGPTGAINGTPMVDNVRSRHLSNSLKARLV